VFNSLIVTLKPQSNGLSDSNTVIGTLAVDGWAVTFGTARRGLVSQCLIPTSSYPIWHYNLLSLHSKGLRQNNFVLWILKQNLAQLRNSVTNLENVWCSFWQIRAPYRDLGPSYLLLSMSLIFIHVYTASSI